MAFELAAQDLLDAIDIPAALLDRDHRVVGVNGAAATFAADDGAPGLRLIYGRDWADLCREADADGPTASGIEGLVAGIGGEGRSASSAIEYAAGRRGHSKAFRLTAKVLPAAGGLILVTQSDLTRLGVSEQRLLEAEQRLADIAEVSSDWFWETDADHRFTHMSAVNRVVLRVEHVQIIGRRRVDLLDPSLTDPEARARHVDDLEAHRPFRDFVYASSNLDQVRYLKVSGKPRFDGEGRFLGYIGTTTDVTAVVEAKKQEELTERRLRGIAQLSSDWYWETDVEHRFTYLSEVHDPVIRQSRIRAIGLRRVDLIERSLTDPEGLARHIDDLENHRPFRDFTYGALLEEEVRYLKISGEPRFDTGKKFVGYVGTTTDVTAAVEADKQREAAERRLKAAVDQMPSGVAIWDPDDRLVICNEEYWKNGGIVGPVAIGKTFEELARSFRSVIPGATDDATFEAKIQVRLDLHRNPGRPIELPLADGCVRQVIERRLEDGSTVSVTTDITALKARERVLAEQRALLQTTLDHISDGILALDQSWRIVAVNDTFAELLGMPEEVARVGTHLATVIECLAQRGDYGEGRANVIAGRILDAIAGRARWYDERSVPSGRLISWRVREMQNGGRVVALADVSEQRQAEQRREQVRTTMAQAQKLEAISRLAGGLAHDLNNMLLPVMTLTELAMDELPAGSPAYGDLERVIGAAEHARGLVQRLLTFSRIGAPTGDPTAIDPAVHEATELVRATAGPDLAIHLDLRAQGVVVPLGDTEIQQVVMNLGLNAAQAIGDRPGTLTIETALIEADDDRLRANPDLDSARRYARLSVIDDGPGIPPEILPRIFDPFFTTKPVGQGTGLGLAVVHGLASQVGGAVEVSCAGGARFDVLLPVVEGAEKLGIKGESDGEHSADR